MNLIVGQLSVIVVIVRFAIAVLIWTSRRKFKKKGELLAIKIFFSKVKLATYVLLEVFSDIKWPGSL